MTTMTDLSPDLTAMVSSRICHDLISPIGAINNGMELLNMSGMGQSPELSLISDSVEAANARIRFFRIAYGSPARGQTLGRGDVLSILRDLAKGGRVDLHWSPTEDLPREEVKTAFLAIQCAEQAVPYGGSITAHWDGQRWNITARAERYALDKSLWRILSAAQMPTDVQPAHVQFLLLPQAAQALGRKVSFVQDESGVHLIV